MDRLDSLNYMEARIPGFANRLMEMYLSCIENIRQRRELDGEQDRLLQRQRRIQMLRELRQAQPTPQQQQTQRNRTNEQDSSVVRKFWEEIVPNLSDERFQKKFRVSNETFNYLANKLSVQLEDNSKIHVELRKKIAISLYILKSNSSIHKISKIFRISKKLSWKIFEEFCNSVNNIFYREYVMFPRNNLWVENEAREFKNQSGFPDCFGIVDCLHIPIKKDGYSKDCLNIKGYYSLVLISVVNSKSKFSYMHFGSPGKYSNSQILNHSMVEENMIGHDDNFHMLGNETFPLRGCLMTPFEPDPDNRSFRNELFNANHAKATANSNVAFNRMKGRWRILMKKPKFPLELWKQVMKTCVILHNLCESRNEVYYPQWQDKVDFFNERYPQPRQKFQFMRQFLHATEKRNEIAEKLWKDFVEQ